MKKSRQTISKTLVFLSAAMLVGGSLALSAVQAGTAADPLVTQSYAQGTFSNKVAQAAAAQADEKLDAAQSALDDLLVSAQGKYDESTLEDMLAKRVAATMGAAAQVNASFPAMTNIKTLFGTEICITSGTAKLTSGSMINVTTGKKIAIGSVLTQKHVYLTAETGAALQTASAVQAKVQGSYTTTAASGNAGEKPAQYTSYADALHDLGLFAGSNTGYELSRVSTRAEGLVMLLRLLGEEEAARTYGGAHPFQDVPAWADRYVAYAYSKGYTSGVSATQYGSQNKLSMNDYMTFLLRALKYNDSKGDFSWRTAADTAVKYGILSAAEKQSIDSLGAFYRDDIVYTSYKTLYIKMNGKKTRLCDYLIEQGVFAQVDLDNAAEKIL